LKNFIAGHDVSLPPASETHTQSTPGVDAVAANPQSKSNDEVITLQQPKTQQDEPPITKPKVESKRQDKGLDKLVDRIIHPTVRSDGGKASPTTKAPAKGFGHGPAATLLKRRCGLTG
jgi:hypothetical protein